MVLFVQSNVCKKTTKLGATMAMRRCGLSTAVAVLLASCAGTDAWWDNGHMLVAVS
jgi:hypothetical protein